MLVVVAVGGNALLRRGETPDAETQRRNVAVAARALAPLALRHQLVITHGNGPQVGLLAVQSLAAGEVYPLDVLGAESQGLIGYLLETALRNELPSRAITTLLGQVLVDAADPAFAHPTKPVGLVYDEGAANRVAAEHRWTMGRERAGFRRLVPSPEPAEILELPAIRALLAAGVLTITAGGGGVPIVRDAGGCLSGVEGVVDKDLSASLLARSLGADALLLLTDVEAVFERWGDPVARTIRGATPSAMRRFSFEAGSMGPKVEAACRFVDAPGRFAVIGALERAAAVLAGESGTRIALDGPELELWEQDR